MKRNIYIDGENLVHIILNCLIDKKVIKNRTQLDNFDLLYIIDFVSRARPGKANNVRYYGARLSIVDTNTDLNKLSKKMVKWNSKWINVLSKQGIMFIKCGYLKVRDSHKCLSCGQVDQIFMEKGVDVGMAVDIVSDALRGEVDEIIIFSADSDMLPAVKRAHGAGVKVIYAAYSGAMNRALTTMADEVWTYSTDQIMTGYKKAKHG